MNSDTAEAAQDGSTRATAADDLHPGRHRGTRVVLWVMSDGAFDASSLAKHVAAAHGGAASVTIVSVEEIPANASPHAMPIDDVSASVLVGPRRPPCKAEPGAPIAGHDGGTRSGDSAQSTRAGAARSPAKILPFREPVTPQRRLHEDRHGAHAGRQELHFRRRRDRPHPIAERAAQPLQRGLLRRVSDALGDRSGDLAGRSAEVPTTPGCATQTPPRSSSAHGAAPPSAARELRLTVMVASGRQGWLEALMPRWASEPDITVLGDPVTDPARLLMSLRQRQPGLLLLDQRLFDCLGPEAARTIAATVPGVRVLLLCDEVCAGLVEAVLRNRFHGVLLASGSPDASVKAIRVVSCGELWLPRTLLANAAFDPLQAPALGDGAAQVVRSLDDVKDALTPREAQVVEHLRQGFTNKEIARRLGIMEDTVKKHLQGVFAKVGVHRRALVVLRSTAAP